ncbi:tumor protein p53-inducible nuclear protein 2 isoform X1 [Callorhinchus milii]|uniref:Tumor protein p53 inducible nuclear protein 2 n=1 Tax=Callorhinchus milii TaxID=7868 RepID=A0A4W3IFC0_CALMI|nr:tumor protein p53-inducible nuclear protein 2 isoform X1 [Callorhinchus milii]|eukprot:gi/632983485/ref/XP_007908670.1/ PREDICTED: tumor protein p53-inducible nuclear protein 2 isoform X1 [Callorhinchus milii]
MFHRFTSLFYGGSENTCIEGPDPSLTEKEDDGWLIVDFPEGQEPGEVEISPLENLLIEHPSMSVYAGSNTNISTMEDEPSEVPSSSFETARPRSETENALLLLFAQQGRSARQPRAERLTAPSPAVAAGIQSSLVEKVSQVRRLQRAKQRMERHQLSRNRIQRQNLTRECRLHRTKHHGSFVYQPRQRHCNY